MKSIKLTLMLLTLFMLVGCGAAAADRPAPHDKIEVAVGVTGVEAELWTTIIKQAFIIEALQGEIIALQEGGGDYGFIYTVGAGQTLWDIASEVYGDPYMWIGIYTVNWWMGDPNMIYPNQVLIMP